MSKAKYRSLVRSLGEEHSAVAIVRTILTLAEILEMTVIIEGIENSAQLRQLQALGGRYVQGFYFAEPMDSEELEKVVRQGLPAEWVLRRSKAKADGKDTETRGAAPRSEIPSALSA